MIDPSLRGLHWLEGVGSIFVLKKAYISGLRGGGYSPLSPPPPQYPPLPILLDNSQFVNYRTVSCYACGFNFTGVLCCCLHYLFLSVIASLRVNLFSSAISEHHLHSVSEVQQLLEYGTQL